LTKGGPQQKSSVESGRTITILPRISESFVQTSTLNRQEIAPSSRPMNLQCAGGSFSIFRMHFGDVVRRNANGRVTDIYVGRVGRIRKSIRRLEKSCTARRAISARRRERIRFFANLTGEHRHRKTTNSAIQPHSLPLDPMRHTRVLSKNSNSEIQNLVTPQNTASLAR